MADSTHAWQEKLAYAGPYVCALAGTAQLTFGLCQVLRPLGYCALPQPPNSSLTCVKEDGLSRIHVHSSRGKGARRRCG